MNLRLNDEARAEIDSVMRWYEDQRVGLGIEFSEAVDAALDLIEERPDSGWVVGRRGHRVLVMNRFPYQIYYSIIEEDIWIYAVAHERRDPGYWQHLHSD